MKYNEWESMHQRQDKRCPADPAMENLRWTLATSSYPSLAKRFEESTPEAFREVRPSEV